MNKKLAVAAIGAVICLIGAYVFFNKGFRRAELNWEMANDPDIAGYNVYYGSSSRTGDCPAGGGYPEKADAGKESRLIVEGLDLGKTYYFSITSYDASGNESCFSPEVQKRIPNNFLFNIFSRLK